MLSPKTPHKRSKTMDFDKKVEQLIIEETKNLEPDLFQRLTFDSDNLIGSNQLITVWREGKYSYYVVSNSQNRVIYSIIETPFSGRYLFLIETWAMKVVLAIDKAIREAEGE
jgi:hypothetical protein